MKTSCTLLICCLFFSRSVFSQSTQPNIIFISLDDQNDYTEGFDGNPQVETPNIKRLEALGTIFYNAYCPAPQCGPSRASMFTGKDVAYTQIYNNTSYACRNFRSNFTAEQGNEEVVTLPEFLKDSAGYFTYQLNKLMHCYENGIDYDSITPDICDKKFSWNKIFIYNDSAFIAQIAEAHLGGPKQFPWAKLDNSYETQLADYIMTDSAIAFINAYAVDPSIACNKPLFLGLGFLKPHLPYYIPEKYFSAMYEDFYAMPFDKPYNYPANAYPFNGVVMPPQPPVPYSDYDALPVGGVARSLADAGLEGNYSNFVDLLDPRPAIDPNISEAAITEILNQTVRANAVLAYLAAIKYVDVQIGRFLDALEANPEVYSNTIIVLFGDHGFSLGEKKHWRKGSLWETDMRAPLIYIDLRNPKAQVSERLVSFTDIFPTLCDAINSPYPIFPDMPDYLDGKSMMPLVINPDTVWERPVIGTYIEKELEDQGGCFPQYSIRSDRFHYIKYQSNNVYGVLECDLTKSVLEEELYEIGLHRETDPNEWNNLIDTADYLPVKEYLQQWLPDSNLYMQKTYKALIKNNALPCFALATDTLHLSVDLYDPEGTYMNIHPENLHFIWSTNLSEVTFNTDNLELALSAFPEAIINSGKKLIVYLQVYDTENKLSAFDLKYFYTGDSNTPFASYNAAADGLTACITNYSMSGNYTDTWWDFGEGIIIQDEIPGPYTYEHAGTYTVKNYVQYGNENCTAVYEKVIITQDTPVKTKPLFIFPNPAQQNIRIKIADESGDGSIEIFNAMGQKMYAAFSQQCGCTRFEEIDISHFDEGIYIASFNGSDGNTSGTFIIGR